MNVREFYKTIDAEYPRSLSCDWDNDGIMCCGDLNAEVKKVLVSLDATYEAIRFACDNGFDLLLTHHPMIFKKMGAVIDDEYCGKRVISALSSNLTVMSFHTRLDAGKGGVNDYLADIFGGEIVYFGDCEPGIMRVFDLPEEKNAEEFALMCKEKLGAQSVRLTGKGNVKRIAVVGGAGGDFINDALTCGADLFLTGECSYNASQDAAERGLLVLEAGHYHTEFPVCRRLLEFVNKAGVYGEIFESCSHKTF